ncbi:flippase [Massilia sp. W12]|uniref:flippase n=1 Tax=Massilia sp. W12 TaxID=3126507 RepID=UPI0030D5F65F
MSRPALPPMLARLLQNAGWNLFGQAAPLAAALFAIPVLLHSIGNQRFGLLSIGWMLIGYFSLFDFGLGRALTQLLAQDLAREDSTQEERNAWLWSALALLGGLGLLAGLALWLCTPWIVGSALKIEPELRAEAAAGLPWLAAALPAVVISSALRGVLEAHQAFRLLNLVRLPLGLLTFLAPLAALPFSKEMPALFALLSLARIACSGLMLWACMRVHAGFWQVRIERARFAPLLRFGGWMTVTNVVGPLMVNMDRFLIGSLLSLSAVAYYTTPFEMVTRLLIVAGALSTACFPLFAQHHSRGDWDALRLTYRKSLLWLALSLGPLCAGVALLAPWLLEWWLGAEYAQHSSTVLRWLALGVFINGLAHLPFALVQGLGQAKVTATFHLLELAAYLPLLYALLQIMGIAGVALAWVLRVSLDALLLFVYSARILRPQQPEHT